MSPGIFPQKAPNGYRRLVVRLNRFPQGAPPGDLLYRILALLVNEREAALLARLPLRPFSAARAGRIWQMSERSAASLLEGLAGRGMLLDLELEGRMLFQLPPPMAGFFEFSLMRVRQDIDQQELGRLYYQYLNVEEAFVSQLFAGGRTQIGRVFVSEPSLAEGALTQVLEYESASQVIRSAGSIAVGMCYCRHKMHLNGRACSAPLDNCMTLNLAADSLIRHGHARPIDTVQALDLLQEARERHLVQCGDNVRKGVNFICHCCGCCCEALQAARRLAIPQPLHTTNFLAVATGAHCNGCGACQAVCPILAIGRPTPAHGREGASQVAPDAAVCLGCGVCVRVCSRGALRMEPRQRRVVTPVNTVHRVVLMAIERGTLQHLLFDDQTRISHRLMAALLGVILRLPPLKRLLACQQLHSRYLERLVEGVGLAPGD